MKSKMTLEEINDIKSMKGISMIQDMEKALVDDLSKTIDKKIIINNIFKIGRYKVKNRLKSIEKIINKTKLS